MRPCPAGWTCFDGGGRTGGLVFRFYREEPHQLLQIGGLSAHLLGGGGKFFGGRGILLGDLVELAHRGVHLIDAYGLLLGRRGDFLD